MAIHQVNNGRRVSVGRLRDCHDSIATPERNPQFYIHLVPSPDYLSSAHTSKSRISSTLTATSQLILDHPDRLH